MIKKNSVLISKEKKILLFLSKTDLHSTLLKTGEVSGYNDVGQVMFKTLTKTTNHKEVINFLKRILLKILD